MAPAWPAGAQVKNRLAGGGKTGPCLPACPPWEPAAHTRQHRHALSLSQQRLRLPRRMHTEDGPSPQASDEALSAEPPEEASAPARERAQRPTLGPVAPGHPTERGRGQRANGDLGRPEMPVPQGLAPGATCTEDGGGPCPGMTHHHGQSCGRFRSSAP